MTTVHKAAGIILSDGAVAVSSGVMIRGGKLLVERSPGKGKHTFVAPGGKLEDGESHEQALVRELMEELGITVLAQDLELYSTDEAEAANNPGTRVVMKSYLVKKWQGTPHPSGEVEELVWVKMQDIGTVPIGSIFEHSVMPKLHADGMIN